MNLIRPSVAFSLALALGACAKVEEHPTDSTSIAVSTESTSVSSTTSSIPAPSQQPQIQVAASTGARIGDSEERIKTLYPNQVSISPSKYAAGGHYLTVVPASAADGAYRIIFETDGKRVVNYRAGLRPQVEYVEGCG